MIVYGWSEKNIKQAPLDNYECPHCQQKQSVLIISAKYVHIFWIPVFPFKKSALIVCSHCNAKTEEKSITLSTTTTIKQLKGAVPLPKYLFSGLALIILAVGFFTYTGIQENQREQAYINEPQIGDVYLIKDNAETSQYNHYLLKIRDIAGDSLWVSYSSFSYNGIISQLDPKDGFYDIMYPMHQEGVKEFSKTGGLKKVFRDYTTSSGFDREIEYEEPDSLYID